MTTIDTDGDRSVLGSLETLEWVYQSAPIGLCVLDRQLRYVRINDFLAHLNGLPPEAHIGRTVREVIPAVADIVEGIAERIFSHGMPELVTEGPGIDRGRPDRPGVWSAAWYPIKDAAGTIVGLNVMVEDITERRNAERNLQATLATLERRVEERTAELAASERKYRALAENIRDIPFLMDRNGLLQYVGPQVRAYGLEPEQMLGTHFLALVHPDDRARVEANFHESLQHDVDRLLELRLVTPARGVCHFEESDVVQRGPDGQVTGLTGIIRDVTESRLAAQAVRESEEKYRRLFETESDCIILMDAATGQLLDVNDAALRSYGYTRAEFLGLTIEQVSAEPDASRVLIDQVKANGAAHSHLRWHLRKDGTRFPLDVRVARYTWRGREVLFGVGRDITEQLAREDENRRQREALGRLAREVTAAAERERKRIATDLHDNLAQLLVSCQVRIDQLLQQARPHALKPTLRRVWDILDRAVKDTRDLTFRLAPPALEEAGLSAALDQLCADLSEEYALPFVFRENGPVAPLTFPLRQVVFRCTREAAVNAGRHAEARRVSVDLAGTPDGLSVAIEDDGRGFDARKAGFDFSAEGGFGLFSARQQLLHAGASLAIHSTPGKGTRVVIAVPRPGPGETT